MTNPVRPTVTITACHRVEFFTPYPDAPRRVASDDGTTARFNDWAISERVLSLRGTRGGGPGRHVGDYEPDDADRIRAWCKAEGLDVEDDGNTIVRDATLVVYGAHRLCHRVEELMHRRVIDARSPAGDALLDLHQALQDLRGHADIPSRPFERFEADVAAGRLP